jgi:hypothetical protein
VRLDAGIGLVLNGPQRCVWLRNQGHLTNWTIRPLAADHKRVGPLA